MSAPGRSKRWLLSALGHTSTRVALALAVVGLLFLLAELQSPSRLYWTGEAVPGTNSGGIVFYTVDGKEYTVAAAGDAPARDIPVTVYVDRGDPTTGLVSRPTRWVDAATVLLWFVAAAACLVAGAVRRARLRRRHPAGDTGGQAFGDGLSADLVQRYLDQTRRPPRRPPPG